MRTLILQIVFATILFSTALAQSNVNKPDIEFKTVKHVEDKQNVYFDYLYVNDLVKIIDRDATYMSFDIDGITSSTQFELINEALTNYSEVYSSKIYPSSYNTNRCFLITTSVMSILN